MSYESPVVFRSSSLLGIGLNSTALKQRRQSRGSIQKALPQTSW